MNDAFKQLPGGALCEKTHVWWKFKKLYESLYNIQLSQCVNRSNGFTARSVTGRIGHCVLPPPTPLRPFPCLNLLEGIWHWLCPTVFMPQNVTQCQNLIHSILSRLNVRHKDAVLHTVYTGWYTTAIFYYTVIRMHVLLIGLLTWFLNKKSLPEIEQYVICYHLYVVIIFPIFSTGSITYKCSLVLALTQFNPLQKPCK